MIEKIRNWFYARRLKAQKRRGLFEVNQDLIYLKTFKKDMLDYDESKARKRMAELKAKENRTEKEDIELDGVLDVIAQSKGTKNEYNQSARLAEDLKKYISTL